LHPGIMHLLNKNTNAKQIHLFCGTIFRWYNM